MKKILSVLSILLVTVMMLSLFGCTDDSGKSDKNGSDKNDAAEIVLTDVLADINDEFSVPLENMLTLEKAEDLEDYYRIAPADVKQFAAQTTKNVATDVTEIILVEAVDEEAAQRVFDLLQFRYDSQRDQCASYSAELLAIINKCTVEINGNFVSLIMDANAKDMVKYYHSCFE